MNYSIGTYTPFIFIYWKLRFFNVNIFLDVGILRLYTFDRWTIVVFQGHIQYSAIIIIIMTIFAHSRRRNSKRKPGARTYIITQHDDDGDVLKTEFSLLFRPFSFFFHFPLSQLPPGSGPPKVKTRRMGRDECARTCEEGRRVEIVNSSVYECSSISNLVVII